MKKKSTQTGKGAGGNASRLLLDAAKRKDFAAMHDLLDRQSSLSAEDRRVREAFIGSAFSEDLSLVQKFLNLGIDINSDVNGHRLLVPVAACPNEEFFKGLLRMGADIHLKGWEGMTPLIMAAATAAQVSDPGVHLKRVKHLVKLGANIDETDAYGRTALDYGFRGESVGLVTLLLKLGASLSACSGGGEDCLSHAMNSTDDRLLKLALKAGADPNWAVCGDGQSLMEYFANRGSEKKVRIMIRTGLPRRLPDGRDALEVVRSQARAIDTLFDLADRAQELQQRLRRIASRIPELRADCMYLGETGYFLGRQPCFCPCNDSLAVRIGKEALTAAFSIAGVSRFEQNRRIMPDWGLLAPELIQEDGELERWIDRAVKYIQTLSRRK